MARNFANNLESFITRALAEVVDSLDFDEPAYGQMEDQAQCLRGRLADLPADGADADPHIAALKSLLELQEKIGNLKFRHAYLCGYRDSNLMREYLWPEEDFS